jgi:hypothetical protein
MNTSGLQSTLSASNFQTPLGNIVTCKNAESILVTDSVSCDGRFVLYTIAAAVLSKNMNPSLYQSPFVAKSVKLHPKKSRVLWINCTSVVNESIVHAFKKVGLERDVISSILIGGPAKQRFDGSERLFIHSVASSIAEANVQVDDITSVNALYLLIKDFVSKRDDNSINDPIVVVLDDISALSALFGERLVYSFVLSLNSPSRSSSHPFGLVVRCSNDCDVDASGVYATSQIGSDNSSATGDVPWERSLVELADSIINVTLLPSGYSRDVHGRLTLSGRSAETSFIGTYNFCLTDNQVLLKRLVDYQK